MRRGYTSIDNLLPFLKGRVLSEDSEGQIILDPVTTSFISALRPSSVEVGPGPWTCDSQLWRVRVYTRQKHKVWRICGISQEVEIELPDSIENGYDLQCQLKGVENPFKGKRSICIVNARAVRRSSET